MIEAFEKLGGVESLVAWGQANPDAFYPMWSKLLPHEITGADGESLTVYACLPFAPGSQPKEPETKEPDAGG
jgi:hypothetical protein